MTSSAPHSAVLQHGVCKGSLWKQCEATGRRLDETAKSFDFCVLMGVTLASFTDFAAFNRGDHPTNIIRIVGASAWNPKDNHKTAKSSTTASTSTSSIQFRMVTFQGTHVYCTALTPQDAQVWLVALHAGLEASIWHATVEPVVLRPPSPGKQGRKGVGLFGRQQQHISCQSCGRHADPTHPMDRKMAPLPQYGYESRCHVCAECLVSQGTWWNIFCTTELYKSYQHMQAALAKAKEQIQTIGGQSDGGNGENDMSLSHLLQSSEFTKLRRTCPQLEHECNLLESGQINLLEFLENVLRDESTTQQQGELKKQAFRVAGDMGSAIQLLHDYAMGDDTEMLRYILDFFLDLCQEGDLQSVAFFWPQLQCIHLKLLPPTNYKELEKVELLEDFLLTVGTQFSVQLALELIWGCTADLEESLFEVQVPTACRRRRFAVLRFVCELESLLFDFGDGWGGGSVSLRQMLTPSPHQVSIMRDNMLGLQKMRREGNLHLSRSTRMDKLRQAKFHKPLEVAAQEALLSAKNADYFSSHLSFTRRICDVAEKLRFLEVEERRPMLEKELSLLNASGGMGGDPLNRVSSNDALARVVRIPVTEGHVFRSKERTPVLLLMEVVEEGHEEDDDNDESKEPESAVNDSEANHKEGEGANGKVALKHRKDGDLPAESMPAPDAGVDHAETAQDGEDDEAVAPTDDAVAPTDDAALDTPVATESETVNESSPQDDTAESEAAQSEDETQATAASDEDGVLETATGTAEAGGDSVESSTPENEESTPKGSEDSKETDNPVTPLEDDVGGNAQEEGKESNEEPDSGVDQEEEEEEPNEEPDNGVDQSSVSEPPKSEPSGDDAAVSSPKPSVDGGSVEETVSHSPRALGKFKRVDSCDNDDVPKTPSRDAMEKIVSDVVTQQLNLPDLAVERSSSTEEAIEEEPSESENANSTDDFGPTTKMKRTTSINRKMTPLGEDPGSSPANDEIRRDVLTAIMSRGFGGGHAIAATLTHAAQKSLQQLDRKRAVSYILNEEEAQSPESSGYVAPELGNKREVEELKRKKLLELGLADAVVKADLEDERTEAPSEEDEAMESLRLLLIQNKVSQTAVSLGATNGLQGSSSLRNVNARADAPVDKSEMIEIDAGDVDPRLAGCGALPPAALSALTLWKGGVISDGELLELVKKDIQFIQQVEMSEAKLLEDSAFWGRFAFGERWAEKRARIAASSPQGCTPGWDLTGVIVKSNDDLRQEAFVMQLIELCQEAFESAGLELWLNPYRIIATGRTTGIIEMVRNAMSVDALKKRPGYSTLAEHLRKMAEFSSNPGEAHRSAQHNFVRSLSAYSLLSYFFLFKDRHNGNILLDTAGHVIHIDFGFVFGIAPGGSFSLEMSTPFKLTEEMMEVMGGMQSPLFGEFVTLFCCGFLALQAHMDTFLTIIEITCSRSPFKCFEGREPEEIVSKMRARFCPELGKEATVAFALDLIKQATSSYGTKQYDYFQYLSQGIAT